MKTPFLGGHICISTTLITKAHTFFSAACKLLFFSVEKKLDRVEREGREKTDIFLSGEAPRELNNAMGNSLIPLRSPLLWSV